MKVKYLKGKLLIMILLALAAGSCSHPEPDKGTWIITPPAQNEYTVRNPDGLTIIPNGRFITPLGKQIITAPHPYGLTVSRDGKYVITANSGISPISISIISDPGSQNPTLIQVPKDGAGDEGILSSVYMGLAVSPDNRKVYVAAGQENKIYAFNLAGGDVTDTIDCSIFRGQVLIKDGFIGDLRLTSEGKYIYAVDQVNFQLLKIDTRSKKVVERVATGRYPFGLAFSPDESRIYVANVGMYSYSYLKSLDTSNLKGTSVDFPVAAYLSEESIKGVDTDSVKFEGLGDPNVKESFSVWAFDIQSEVPGLISQAKTGFLVGEKIEGIPAVGGSSPNSIVASSKYVFVSNGNNDCISVLDPQSNALVTQIRLQPDQRLKNFRGIIPFGLCKSPDDKYVFVAEAGINSVAVISTTDLSVIGRFPVTWFPSKLEVSGDGKTLFVAGAKGFGSGPNGGKNASLGSGSGYIGELMKGSVSVIDLKDVFKNLDKYSKKVLDNNFIFTKLRDSVPNSVVPPFPGIGTSPVKHLVFISKENRTYDEVFGQIREGKGDESLARFGLHARVYNHFKTDSIIDVDVMPNHIALAERFSISDNFYVDSDVSADGHRWLVCTYPNEWVEANTPSSYGGGRSPVAGSGSPGNLGREGASGAIYPEDYNEAGSMWEHLERNKVSFFNFGFGIMFEPHYALQEFKYTGYRHLINYPVPAPIYNKTSRTYPTYNMAITDQFRVDMFIKEFNEKWLSGTDNMPSILTVIIPNDHGAGERPEEGYPFHESYMADNDLAVGRIVEFLSHTPYWKNMAIIITEDDAQGGVDHVDAHRSVLMVISPFARPGYVSHVHTSFGSIFKTFWNILGIPYLNQYDAGANDFSDMFSITPDYTPYSALPVNTHLFDPEKALDPLDEGWEWKPGEDLPDIDDPEYIREKQF